MSFAGRADAIKKHRRALPASVAHLDDSGSNYPIDGRASPNWFGPARLCSNAGGGCWLRFGELPSVRPSVWLDCDSAVSAPAKIEGLASGTEEAY